MAQDVHPPERNREGVAAPMGRKASFPPSVPRQVIENEGDCSTLLKGTEWLEFRLVLWNVESTSRVVDECGNGS